MKNSPHFSYSAQSSVESGYESLVSSPQPFYAPFPLLSSLSSTSSKSTSSSGHVSKRGRKPKRWSDEDHNKQYLRDAVNEEDKLKRRNNISSGIYRKNKQERKAELEIEAEIEKIKQRKLKKVVKKNEKKIALFQELLVSLSRKATIFQFNSL